MIRIMFLSIGVLLITLGMVDLVAAEIFEKDLTGVWWSALALIFGGSGMWVAGKEIGNKNRPKEEEEEPPRPIE